MGANIRIGLSLLFLLQFNWSALAQSGIITTYVGPGLPVDGALAVTQAIDNPNAVAIDHSGVLFVASATQQRVYRVAADGRLSLVAGGGSSDLGDGGLATSAQLTPSALAFDSAGNLYIADVPHARVRKVTPAGIISTVAGSVRGYGGDGGPATSAQLDQPTGLAVDSSGNLYIADRANSNIRIVTSAGIISTLAGNGMWGYGGDGGPATSARLAGPNGLAVDSAGNLYIADTYNYRVRKVTPAGTISTLAGNGAIGFNGDGGPATSAQLDDPTGVTVDLKGNLYIADQGANRIRMVTSSGIISTVAGNGWPTGFSGDGGPAISAQLNNPTDVGADGTGNLYIADLNNARVRKVTPAGIISTVAGNGSYGFGGDGGPATSARLNNPRGVTMDGTGNLYIADHDNHRVRRVTPAGIITTAAGNGMPGFSGDGGPATLAQLNCPGSVAVDSSNNLYIADMVNYRIRKVTPDGVITTVAGSGTPDFSGDGGPATSAQMYLPTGVAVDAGGDIFVSDAQRIRKVTPDGIISTFAGTGKQGYSGDGGPAISAQLNSPAGLACDAGGNLYIADDGDGNDIIRKVNPAGIISTVAPNDRSVSLSSPGGVVVDPAGNLYIADTRHHRILDVTPAGITKTVAGTGTAGFSGDGGPATSALLNFPSSMAVDAAGNVFIADTSNNRIRKVTPPRSSLTLSLNAGGAARSSTLGADGITQVGYAIASVNSGTAPYGTAVFSFKQNGFTVSEAGVPASPPATSARIFVDYRSSTRALPGRISAGVVDIYTGIAVVNYGLATANVTYTLRDPNGIILSVGHGAIAAGTHFARFLNQMKEVAPDFSLPTGFETTIQFGSLEISSDQPLSILALRQTINQRDETLFTTTPIADLTASLTNSSIYFPQFVDGGGYATTLIFLNTSLGLETGAFQLLDDNGAPLVVNQVGGTADSSFKYSIPPGGAYRFQTDGFPTTTKAGWVRLTPDPQTSTPVGAGVLSYNPGNVLVTESGIPSSPSTTHARVYVDLSGTYDTGLAIANLSGINADVTINAYQSDGATQVGKGNSLQLAGSGHTARFANELIAGLPGGFVGVIDISSAMPFAALTVRSLNNERNDFLLTTFPVADLNHPAPSPVIFPQIADGGGYVTQFILLSSGASSTTLNFYGETGAPLVVGR